MGCTACPALAGTATLALAAVAMAAMFFERMAPEAAGFFVVLALVYAGSAALCYPALARRR